MDLLPRSSHFNDTGWALNVTCAFPLSQPYELMPRVLIYPLLWLALFSRTALLIAMLWTSVASIHLSALAVHHSSNVLDSDVLIAYEFTNLGLVFAPAYMLLARGLKGSNRADVLSFGSWMMILWTGTVSFVASMKSQPRQHPAIDHHGHNITSRALLSSSLFQCNNMSSKHAMRTGQSAVLITVPEVWYNGHHHTDRQAVSVTLLGFLCVYGSFMMMASEKLLSKWVEKFENAEDEREKNSYANLLLIPPGFAFFSFITLVILGERSVKHVPERYHKDGIAQWGPMVAGALFLGGVVLRLVKVGIDAGWKKDNRQTQSKDEKKDGVAAPPGDSEAAAGVEGSTVVSLKTPETVHATGGASGKGRRASKARSVRESNDDGIDVSDMLGSFNF